jgi:hypothetical protein
MSSATRITTKRTHYTTIEKLKIIERVNQKLVYFTSVEFQMEQYAVG